MPAKSRDLVGRRCGTLVVVSRAEGPTTKNSWWDCKCDCGEGKVVRGDVIDRGEATCLACTAHAGQTHGMTGTKVYEAWQGMHSRCSAKPGTKHHKDYVSRGIKVCERWSSFENFYADMGDPPSPENSIDRRENDKGYEPGNCRWATTREQNLNCRRNTRHTIDGETLTLTEWCERHGQDRHRVIGRLRCGWPIKLALTTPRGTTHALKKLVAAQAVKD